MSQYQLSSLGLAACLCLTIAGSVAGAEESSKPAEVGEGRAPVVEIPESYRKRIRTRNSDFIRSQITELFKYNASGVVTSQDIVLMKRIQFAERRAGGLANFLSFDLDGNGTITRSEFDSISGKVSLRGKPLLAIAFSRYDRDGNDALDLEEITEAVEDDVEHSLKRYPQFSDSPMMYDRNRDGKVDVREMMEVFDEIASEPSPEPAPVRAPQTRGRPVCKLPAPSEAASIVIVSGYEGSALSSVAVSGVDNDTTVATLKIEPGSSPLYIFATAYDPIIWKLSGEAGRVERFVVQPSRTKTGPGAGVVGLPKDKVSFSSAGSCGTHATSPQGAKAIRLKTKVGSALGRGIDYMAASYTLRGISLPSGETSVTPNGARPSRYIAHTKHVRTERELYRFNPDGVMEFDAEDIVAAAPVVKYDVLPGEAGLLQLLKSGALERGEDGEYIIQKPIARFPAGLAGAHSVEFVLKAGVEMPKGSLGHSSLLREDTGECLGVRCRH